MKLAICTVAYNEAKNIGACIDNWKDVVSHHLVLVSAKPWNGSRVEADDTVRISKRRGAEVIIGPWETEAIQRSWGIARLYDYDYVLIIDPDEFYTKQDQKTLLNALESETRKDPTKQWIPTFKPVKILTYWKSYDYILDPPDRHKPIIAVDPKQAYCYEHRNFVELSSSDRITPVGTTMPLDIICHHMSWVHSDAKAKEKIQSYSHADIIKPHWYDEVWLGWVPGSNMQVKPYYTDTDKAIAVKCRAPQEIIDLIEKSR